MFSTQVAGGRIASVSDESCQAIAFSYAPFCIHQHGEALLKGNSLELGILQLDREGSDHDAQEHLLKLAYSFVAQHGLFHPTVAACTSGELMSLWLFFFGPVLLAAICSVLILVVSQGW